MVFLSDPNSILNKTFKWTIFKCFHGINLFEGRYKYEGANWKGSRKERKRRKKGNINKRGVRRTNFRRRPIPYGIRVGIIRNKGRAIYGRKIYRREVRRINDRRFYNQYVLLWLEIFIGGRRARVREERIIRFKYINLFPLKSAFTPYDLDPIFWKSSYLGLGGPMFRYGGNFLNLTGYIGGL